MMRSILLMVGLLFAASVAGANTLPVPDSKAAVWTRFDSGDRSSLGRPQTVQTTYDARGYAVKRVFLSDGSQQTQTLTWDGAGRLTAVSQRDQTSNNGYDWTALYDGLGRRLQTVYTPVDGGVACPKLAVTQESWYDPEVEFLEIGVSVNGQKHWKMYGPDLDGVYGGLQGIGGLEAVINQSDGVVTPVVNDAFGNAVASVNNNTVVVWNPTRVGGYGPLPGSSAQWLSTNTTLATATVWRGKRMDPTGYYWMGARYYDPVGGRFLSPDPLGHEASMDLYSYANGDPINACDPDGRFGKNSVIENHKREVQADYDGRSSLFEHNFDLSPTEALAQQLKRENDLQAYWDATTPTVHDPIANVAAAVIRATVDATVIGALGTAYHDMYTGQQWLTGAPISEGEAAFNALVSIGTAPLMMGGAMRPTANVMTRAATRSAARIELPTLSGTSVPRGAAVGFPKNYQGGPGAMYANEGRGLWTLTAKGASKIMNHSTFGTFYKSVSDNLWWVEDMAGHGGSAFKVYRETGKGLEWYRDANQFGDFISAKHKGPVGKFIPWKELRAR